MNRRTPASASAGKALVYPDILGAITDGRRLNVDVLQLAAAARPMTTNAGKPFDALLILQNAANVDVDAVIRLIPPETDLAGQRGHFSSKQTAPIRIGLRPGEVGCANLPIMSTVQAAPGDQYTLKIELQVEQKQRNPSRVRDASGGTLLHIDDLPEDRQQGILDLQGLDYALSVTGKPSGNKVIIPVNFAIMPPVITGLPPEVKTGYTALWTAADYPDPEALAAKVKPITSAILPNLRRNVVFFPLLKATQAYFEGAQYRLWAGEAVAITKLLTLVLELGTSQIDVNEGASYPHWFIKLCRVLILNPQAGSQVEHLLNDLLYFDLVRDAVVFGFAMIANVTNQEFGYPDELNAYAGVVVSALSTKREPLDFMHVYLPLVMAGLISNSRVTMPNEQVRDTANLIAVAQEKRASEANSDNKYVFDMADDLLKRALENF